MPPLNNVAVSVQFDFLKRKAPIAAPVVRPTVTPERQFNIPIALGGEYSQSSQLVAVLAQAAIALSDSADSMRS